MNPSSNRLARRILLVGLLATVALVVVATASNVARIGPVVFWAVHRTSDAESTTVALQPGLGLLLLWVVVVAAAALISRRREV